MPERAGPPRADQGADIVQFAIYAEMNSALLQPDLEGAPRVVLEELVRRHHVRPSRPQSERPFRRAITETPRHNAEVVLS